MAQATLGRRSKNLNRSRFLSCFMGRCDRVACFLPKVVAVLFVVIYCAHRLASYRANSQELVKLPINDIERVCPQPEYAVLGSSSTATKPKICITTLTDAAKADALQRLVRWRNFNSLLDMTWPNKQKYCRKHGYYLFNES
jgi:hypothetical protein